MLLVVAFHSYGTIPSPDRQRTSSPFSPPACIVTGEQSVNEADSIMMPFPVQQTVPQRYEDIMESEFAADLANPSNLRTYAEDRKSVV